MNFFLKFSSKNLHSPKICPIFASQLRETPGQQDEMRTQKR